MASVLFTILVLFIEIPHRIKSLISIQVLVVRRQKPLSFGTLSKDTRSKFLDDCQLTSRYVARCFVDHVLIT